MKIKMSDDEYQSAVTAVEKVLDEAIDTLIKRKGYPETNESVVDGIRSHIVDYATGLC